MVVPSNMTLLNQYQQEQARKVMALILLLSQLGIVNLHMEILQVKTPLETKSSIYAQIFQVPTLFTKVHSFL